ncbi:glycoside hydrolase family 15 [Cellulomonas sp. C5510]|uniref:glycoside hydrolase family 15 n=1 Tax=Cellulomonas sp. C5510 TaxID=2871170 RepID=UPI001C95F73D|nr:glycoside hydrolase family 15 [Cellulomonas sp. C5510]QZN86109.1 glycoside hydrolase family 15 [Cellulomonas sp. C5510]
MPARRATAVVLLAALGAGLVAWGSAGPRDASLPLYAAGVALDVDGAVVDVPVGSEVALHAGTRVLDDPGSRADDVLAAEQRAWLASGSLPGGADGPYADMVADALLDLRTLLLDDGAAVAAWTDRWRYVWPRDAAFVAVALARTGHGDDALDVLGFLERVQAPDGSFEARYLPDGSGPPDDRAPQTDGTGWALWAAGEVVAAQPADRQQPVAERLRGLVTRSAAGAVALTARDGLPPASPDYWEVAEDELTLGTVAPLLAGLESAPALLELLDEEEAAAAAREAAGRTRDAVERAFGDDTAYGRYADGSVADAASAFVLPPLQPRPLAGALDAWQASAAAMERPAGGLAPGAAWKSDGISWTPQTALYALVAAENGRPDDARARLDWLDAHRTPLGALPEKVLADGSPAAVAPLAWTAACVVLAVDALDG